MSESGITIDRRQVEQLGEGYREATEVALRRLVERGEQLVRDEVPKETRNLEQGVSSDVHITNNKLEGFVFASARSGRRNPRAATLHSSSGETRTVQLKPLNRFDYAQGVAEGTGIYGASGKPIVAKRGKALLLPTTKLMMTKSGKPESYIEADGRMFVVRRQIKGRRADNFHLRAGERLEGESQIIVQQAFEIVAQGEPS